MDFVKTYLLDIIFAVVAISIASAFWKKGFIQSISKFGRFVGAGILSYLIGPKVGEIVSDKLIYNGVFNAVSEKISSAVSGVASSIDIEQFLDNLPDLVKKFVDVETLKTQYGSTIDDVNAAAASLAENVSGSISTMLSNAIAYALVFIVGLIVFAILFKILDGVFKLPVLNLVNKLLGVALGLLGAVLFCGLACELLALVIHSASADSGFASYINCSKVFTYFQEHKVFDILPKELLAKFQK